MKLFLMLSMLTVSVHVRKEVRQTNGSVSTAVYDCTGVMVSPTVVLTAGHCLEDVVEKPWINLASSSKPYETTVMAVDHLHDLGLLSVTKLPPQPATKLGAHPYVTQKIYSVHNGNGHLGTYGEGIIENLTNYDETTAVMILHSMPIKHGDSGSGIFNEKGALLGINTLTEDTFSWAVATADITAFLKAYGVIEAH